LVFATDGPAFAEVWVAGERVVAAGRHGRAAALQAAFTDAMEALHG
jgi:hypothetical protein